jgi:iron complex transport system ATP-binding protein
MKGGRTVRAGTPDEVVTVPTVRQVFDLDCDIPADPRTGAPLVVPISRHRRAALG